MPEIQKNIKEDTRFKILRILQRKPEISQREIAQETGISLGGVNYCLSALVKKGQIKIRRFKASNNKLRYAYVLTPIGIAEKIALTGRFLQRKMYEYEALELDIKSIQDELELELKLKLSSNGDGKFK